MLAAIKSFFSAELLVVEDQPQRLQLAAAALLIELSRADFQTDDQERQAIEQALNKAFAIPEQEFKTLIELAEQEAREATSLYQFTRLINDHYSEQEKEKLIELLWQVAAADGEICKYEEHLIRKIADLIYVPHRLFIRSKLTVLGES